MEEKGGGVTPPVILFRDVLGIKYFITVTAYQ